MVGSSKKSSHRVVFTGYSKLETLDAIGPRDSVDTSGRGDSLVNKIAIFWQNTLPRLGRNQFKLVCNQVTGVQTNSHAVIIIANLNDIDRSCGIKA